MDFDTPGTVTYPALQLVITGELVNERTKADTLDAPRDNQV